MEEKPGRQFKALARKQNKIKFSNLSPNLGRSKYKNMLSSDTFYDILIIAKRSTNPFL
jgi:hypothetical protein